MNDIYFIKSGFVQRVKKLMRREGISPTKLVEMTNYNRSTFYRHTNLSSDDEPSPTDLLRLCTVLNTSLDYLLRGYGAEYVSNQKIGSMLKMMEKVYDEEQEAYGILFDMIMELPYEEVETITDVALLYKRDKQYKAELNKQSKRGFGSL